MKKAFTLIELLVVVLIIGILSAIALPQYRKAVFRTRMSQALVIYGSYKQAIDAWLLTNGWPNERIYFTGENDSGALDISMPVKGTSGDFAYIREGLPIKAYCTNTTCLIAVATKEDINGNGLQFYFQRGKNSDSQRKQWGLAGLLKWEGGLVTAESHGVELKVACLWVKEQGKAYWESIKNQCDSVGIEVPY